MPERPKPFESLKLPPERQGEVAIEYEAILGVLSAWHRRFARGRKVEIDKKLARRPGFIADVLAGRRSITLDRLLAFVAELGQSLDDLVQSLEHTPRPGLPAPLSYDRLMSLTATPKHQILRRWAARVDVGPHGHALGVDKRLMLREARNDPRKARKLAHQSLTMTRELLPASLSPTSADDLCWSVAYLASRSRIVDGAYHEAAELLALGVRLEQHLNALPSRALLYREAAHLLCHLGQVHEAERYAQAAVELSLATPDGAGLGESLYVRAMMAKWNGSSRHALRLMQSARFHARNEPTYETAARFAIIYLQIETDAMAAAQDAVEQELEGFSKLAPALQGRLLFFRALIHSHRGRSDLADQDFAASAELLEFENPTDQAIFLLYRCAHLIRHGRNNELADMAHCIPSLIPAFQTGSSGEAALLEASRLCLLGRLTSGEVLKMIRIIERPWASRARTPTSRS